MKNRLRFIYGLFFILILLLPLQVFADGKNLDDLGSPWLSAEDKEDHDHGPIGSPWLSGEGEDDHGGAHGDHGSEYEEPGANLPLLGTFAAINGGFILFGAVRKYRKK